MLCGSADRVCAQGRAQLDDDTYQDLNNLHSHLWSFLRHNTIVLGEHDIPLPFMDRPLPAEYKP
jgi:hypothetical protein